MQIIKPGPCGACRCQAPAGDANRGEAVNRGWRIVRAVLRALAEAANYAAATFERKGRL